MVMIVRGGGLSIVSRWSRDGWACFFFFFQAEDGIRDYKVTGVQTCALPIFAAAGERDRARAVGGLHIATFGEADVDRDHAGAGGDDDLAPDSRVAVRRRLN